MKTFCTWERVLIAICASVLLLVSIDLVLPAGESEIYDSVIRLHVLAQSDSEHDQQIKLAVRDAIVAECRDLFADTDTTDEALTQIQDAALQMEQIANRVLAEQGVAYTATAVFGTETYPTREYDGVTFPAGEYLSLRILLGDGEGQCWWCCLFPPLCMSASTAEDSLESVGIDTSSGKVFTQRKYRFRLKILEWFSCFTE